MFSTTRQLLAYCAMVLGKKIYAPQKCGQPHSEITYEYHTMEKNPSNAMVAANLGNESSKPRNGYTRIVRLLLESVAITAYQEFEREQKRARRDIPTFLQWLKDNSIKLNNVPLDQFWLRSK